MRRTEDRRARFPKPAELSIVLARVEDKINLLVSGAEIKCPAKKRGELIVENESFDISSPDHPKKRNWVKLG